MARTSTSLVQPQEGDVDKRRAYTVTDVVASPASDPDAKSFAVHGREQICVVAHAPVVGEGYDITPWGYDVVSEKWVKLGSATTVAPESTERIVVDTTGIDYIAIEVSNIVGSAPLTNTNAIWLYQPAPRLVNI